MSFQRVTVLFRSIVLTLAACFSTCLPALQAEAGDELLTDPDLTCGLLVLAPALPGSKPIPEGKIQPDESCGAPAWRLAQWSSRTTLAGAEPERQSNGLVRFASETKAVTFAPPKGKEHTVSLL